MDRSALRLDFRDDFAGNALDTDRWLDHYLPHWTTPDRSAARYSLDGAGIRLLIEADQLAWRTEDGPMRVSNIQTGSFSGPAGSVVGQHRHRDDLHVRTPQQFRALWTPTAGFVQATMRASPDPTCMLAIWLVGLESASPEDSGEVCIAELFGNAIGQGGSQLRLGVKAHHDPRLRTEMTDLQLPMDATETHTYAAAWDSRRVLLSVDDQVVRTVDQGISYPLQLMIDLFEFPQDGERNPANYPKSAEVLSVRGFVPR